MKAVRQLRSAPPRRNRWLLRWSGYLLCLMGIVALGYCAYELFAAELHQSCQSQRFEEALKSAKPRAASGALPATPIPPAAQEGTLAPAEGRAAPSRGEDVLVGRIEIRRIGFAAMIMKGIDNRTLRNAVGHIPGTVLPGAPGNVGIAGHRETFFRGLKHIRTEDEITLTTLGGSFRYRVDYTLVVEPRETWVLRDAGDATLTLVTCYPFDYVGPAPQRFIVRAHKVAEDARAVPSEK